MVTAQTPQQLGARYLWWRAGLSPREPVVGHGDVVVKGVDVVG